MISLFVIDDHFLIGCGISEVFNPETDGIKVAGSAPDVHKAMEKIGNLKIDLIVLDLFIGFFDPVRNIRLLKKTFPRIPVVILTHENAIEYQVSMFNEGAMAYLSKNDDKETMKDVFHQVAAGKAVIQGVVLKSEGSTFHNISEGSTIKAIANERQRTTSAIEKTLRKIREKFNARTNYELLVSLAKANKI
jgi:DNA-binding NarL/FixJ family response regulator